MRRNLRVQVIRGNARILARAMEDQDVTADDIASLVDALDGDVGRASHMAPDQLNLYMLCLFMMHVTNE